LRTQAFMLVCALLACGAPCPAGSPRPADPGYTARSLEPQSTPPRAPLCAIVSPSSSAPALVNWGESFEVTLLGPPSQPGQWLVALGTRARNPYGEMVGPPLGMRFPLTVTGLRRDQGDRIVLSVLAPAAAPRDVYHLEVAGPSGLRAVRVYAVRLLGRAGPGDEFSIVVIGDNQLLDPTTKFSGADLNNGSYPRCCDDAAEAMFAQQVDEISFFDPDFVINVGDLLFGIDYRKEYRYTLSRWWKEPIAAFMVPGNHDGMALYELALKDGWWAEALKSVRCARFIIDGDVTAAKVFGVLACVYGDLKKMLFEDLAQEGLDYWRRLLGPLDYSFDAGRFHFVGVNSYSGSPERRHAFVLGLQFLGLDFGAATVDNYGGQLDDGQLAWLRRDLERASKAGKTIVLFLHHDARGARGESWGRGYHANLPFPTEPLGLRKFQEWNYDSDEWDSNPKDKRKGETQTDNSAVRLLRLIARYADYVFTGHIHDDETTVIEPGREIVPGSGIRASKRIHYVRVTTGSATPDDSDGYWGYRLLRARGDALEDLIYYPTFRWQSLPSGNLWVSGTGVPAQGTSAGNLLDRFGGGKLLYVVHSGLPRRVQGMLRAFLPDAPEGYRFPATGGKLRVADVGRAAGGRNVYYLRVELPAVRSGEFPVPAGEEERLTINWERANGNRAPMVSFEIPAGEARPGRAVVFDGSASRDPDGTALIQYVWDFGDGHGARGAKVSHTYSGAGDYDVALTAIDDCGAFARYSTRLTVAPAPSCSLGSGACAATSASLALLCLIMLGWWLYRRRAS